ncbi:hypothetical protein NDU88_008254 [Pleurodeles waltl]|uniref:Uncharacterized protein n=1 Tax=Pleurodeles waltl TaxID=8319 RepID=A0AAV7PNS1_PLEWA|nr:hypothetical protein NDU88_008254 [Pleurodeles waltl]
MLLYPARQKVLLGGTLCFFDTPKDMRQWLEAGDKMPKERNSTWSPGSRKLSAQEGTGRRAREVSEIAHQQSPEVIEPGRVEIQVDGTMALALSVQTGCHFIDAG